MRPKNAAECNAHQVSESHPGDWIWCDECDNWDITKCPPHTRWPENKRAKAKGETYVH